jgi:hypothetical protein
MAEDNKIFNPPASSRVSEVEEAVANETLNEFIYDPTTGFIHADDGGAPEHGIKWVRASSTVSGDDGCCDIKDDIFWLKNTEFGIDNIHTVSSIIRRLERNHTDHVVTTLEAERDALNHLYKSSERTVNALVHERDVLKALVEKMAGALELAGNWLKEEAFYKACGEVLAAYETHKNKGGE